MTHRDTYPIEINGVQRQLQLFEVAPGVRIAILNILGDTELVVAAARALAEKLRGIDFAAFVTADAKAIPLAHQLSLEMQRPYVVLRKSYKSYMGNAIETHTESITTGATQSLYLDEKDLERITGQAVVIVDDVISTGSTLHGMRDIVQRAKATIAAEAAIFTEGDPQKWEQIIALGNLPVWSENP